MTTTSARTPTSALRRSAGRRATAPGALVALAGRAVAERLPLALALAGAMVAMGLLVGALWAPLQETFADLEAELPAGFDALLGGVSLATPAGWVNAELLSLLAPAAVITAAALSASRSVAGEEERATLGVLLAAPLTRTAFLLARLAATAVTVLVVVAGVWAGMLVADATGDLGIGATTAAAAAATHLMLMGLFFAALAVAVAAVTGAARTTAVVVAATGALAFALSTFAPMLDATAALRWFSPWHYFNASAPLLNGVQGAHLAVLAGATAVLAALAVLVYRRRDLRG